ncbi:MULTISPECIES: AbiH family protein [Pectobacterium]|uniref:AbiH family protein n=1 Tax=Pectobacterium TaxID=122277 RepID=UPI0018DAC713|nr:MULTISPECIES: AbiH family protein [Pectobacterium]QPI44536.1 hypothetical protein I2D83_08190 [Pectobacterium aroidearum]
MKLYVIGNGFDLHHGLDTSYFTFGFFLRSCQHDLYDSLPPVISLADRSSDLYRGERKTVLQRPLHLY